MAISFKNIKSTKLGLQDKITFGKFAQCRVCDIIEDQYEYLIWANKAGLVAYTAPVMEKLTKLAGYHQELRYQREEVEPWLKPDYDDSEYTIQNSDLPDVPF